MKLMLLIVIKDKDVNLSWWFNRGVSVMMSFVSQTGVVCGARDADEDTHKSCCCRDHRRLSIGRSSTNSPTLELDSPTHEA